MDAAMDAQAKYGAHTVNVKLYRDLSQGSADGVITYSVDGCGWAGRECNAGNNWSQVIVWDPYRPGRMVFNKIPDRLKDYGRYARKQPKADKVNYREEIIARVVEPCITHGFRGTSLARKIGLYKAVDFWKAMNGKVMDKYVISVKPQVIGKTIGARFKIYNVARMICINTYNEGG